MLKHLRGAVVLSGLTLNTIFWFVPLFGLALCKLLVPIEGFRRWVSRILMTIGENWISVNSLLLRGAGSIHWRARGVEDLDRQGWYLVVANHQTWVDILVLQKVFNRRIPFLKFFIKQQLIWFPLLGIAWWALDMPFMKRYSRGHLARNPHKQGRDLEATRKACEKFQDTPTSVINFVEGTRFSAAKRDAQHTEFTHLLVPRAGGIALTMATMGHLFNAILDVTLVYPDGPATFWNMCCGARVRVIVDVRPRPVDDFLLGGDYQNDRQYRREFHQWLTRIWREKDDHIAAVLEDVQAPDVTAAER